MLTKMDIVRLLAPYTKILVEAKVFDDLADHLYLTLPPILPPHNSPTIIFPGEVHILSSTRRNKTTGKTLELKISSLDPAIDSIPLGSITNSPAMILIIPISATQANGNTGKVD